MMRNILFVFFSLFYTYILSQQVADTNYHPPIVHPAYLPDQGPTIFIDEGHYNFHTKDGRYRSFAQLLQRDGYKVEGYQGKFEIQKLNKGKILVISNALHKENEQKWYVPVHSAFDDEEISIVKKWVEEGGGLFLIADHMPLAGAAIELGAAFGFKFTDGFAMDTTNYGPAFFKLADSTLYPSLLILGRDTCESVDQIATFTGQAFQIPDDATPILTFSDKYTNYLPDTAWHFDASTLTYNVKGWSQGAYKKFGKGKVVAFGEAAMFSAQLAGEEKIKMGMNNEVAPQNYQLLLNIIHWLDGILED